MPDAVLFDLDNTLIDRDAAVRAYIEDLLPRRGVTVSTTLVDRLMCRDDHGYADRDMWCGEIAALASMGTEEVWSDFRFRLPAFVKPIPGVGSMLDHIRNTSRIALVTNGSSALQRAKLAASGLADRFGSDGKSQNVYVSEEVGFRKPDPRLMLLALAGFGCAPENALFVGDDPRRDMAPASEIGMGTCWVRIGRDYPIDCPRPDHQIDRITDLPSRWSR